MENILKRLKNYGTVVAIVSQILAILIATNVVTPAESESINQIILAFLQVLVLLGVLNNPTTNNKGYKEDKPNV